MCLWMFWPRLLLSLIRVSNDTKPLRDFIDVWYSRHVCWIDPFFCLPTYLSLPSLSHLACWVRPFSLTLFTVCFRLAVSSRRLADRYIKKSETTYSLDSCKDFCAKETEFVCNGFAYRWGWSSVQREALDIVLDQDSAEEGTSFKLQSSKKQGLGMGSRFWGRPYFRIKREKLLLFLSSFYRPT